MGRMFQELSLDSQNLMPKISLNKLANQQFWAWKFKSMKWILCIKKEGLLFFYML
jgi:hypothetical protein